MHTRIIHTSHKRFPLVQRFYFSRIFDCTLPGAHSRHSFPTTHKAHAKLLTNQVGNNWKNPFLRTDSLWRTSLGDENTNVLTRFTHFIPILVIKSSFIYNRLNIYKSVWKSHLGCKLSMFFNLSLIIATKNLGWLWLRVTNNHSLLKSLVFISLCIACWPAEIN